MHKNSLYLAFVLVISVVIIGYASFAGWRLWQYWRLDSNTVPIEVEWTVDKVDADNYLVLGRYRYSIGNKEYSGTTIDTKRALHNPWAADARREALAKEPMPVWYASKRPELSTLQKAFPTKECISAAVLLALGLYFLGLGYYVGKTAQ